MKSEFGKLLMKAMKEGKTLDPESNDSKARYDVLNEIMEMLEDVQKDKMHGMKKVTVAAPNVKSLKTGLEKAQEVVEEMPEEEEASDMDEESDLAKLRMLVAKKSMKE